ncbi:hypothetical protein [Collimonas humicola]|uniref:hypothetical protein n=1 Tax=Collimonas humicola TaxID=2825886 RepID=UPI001B8B6671|nr:hypothetical protein [Collimonas humicola]
MKVIGLFKEMVLGADPKAIGISDMVGKLSKTEVISVLEYLKSGVGVFDVMGAERDPLNHSVILSGAASLISDGYWIWRLDLPYYVEKYQIQLNEEFLRQVASPVGREIEIEADIQSKWQGIVACYKAACTAFKL